MEGQACLDPTWEPICRAWGVARDIGTKMWHGTANAATVDSFFLNCIFKWEFYNRTTTWRDGGFHSKLLVPCQELSLLLNRLSSHCSSFPTEELQWSIETPQPWENTPHFSAKRWHKSPHFISLPFESSLCYSHNKNSEVFGGARELSWTTWAQAVAGSVQGECSAALSGTMPALELGSTDGELCLNDRA